MMKQNRSSAQRILSQLTPDTFQDSVSRLKNLSLSTEESLQEVVHLIFEQAMTSPHCCALYVNICRCLLPVRVPCTADPSDQVGVQTLLVRLCRAEYNGMFGAQQREATPPRSLRTIKFIGELYRSRILSGDVMHSCVRRLLRQRDPESLECLCELLATVSPGLELLTPKRVMDSYYDQMEAVAAEPGTPPRVALMLRAAVAARKNSHWEHKSSSGVPQGEGTGSNTEGEEEKGPEAREEKVPEEKEEEEVPEKEVEEAEEEEEEELHVPEEEEQEEEEAELHVPEEPSSEETPNGVPSEVKEDEGRAAGEGPVVFVGVASDGAWPQIDITFGFFDAEVKV